MTLELLFAERNHVCAVCVANGQCGIVVADHAAPVCENNRCEANDDCGIAYRGGGGGRAVANACLRNAQHGILVANTQSPRVYRFPPPFWRPYAYIQREKPPWWPEPDNTNDNVDQLAPLAPSLDRRVAMPYDAWHTTFEERPDQPMLADNVCSANNGSGIAFTGASCGVATGNQCLRNGAFGLSATNSAKPTLVDNRCEGNARGDVNDGRTGA